jgi:hypothetical protein
MSLDAGKMPSRSVAAFDTSIFSDHSVYEPWKHWEPSRVSHHGTMCCEIAREWIIDTDFSVLNGANLLTGPRWLRQRFDWGPGVYPLHWCEVPKKTALDCGILAALSYELFTHRGVRAFRAQLVQKFADSAADHWRSAWEGDSAITAWIDGNVIYHEGCAVLGRSNEIKLWDSSAGWWVDPKTTSGYGSILALKVSSHENMSDLNWGLHKVETNRWITLDNDYD